MVVIVLLCIIAGVVVFYVRNIETRSKPSFENPLYGSAERPREGLAVNTTYSQFNPSREGVIVNAVYSDNGDDATASVDADNAESLAVGGSFLVPVEGNTGYATGSNDGGYYHVAGIGTSTPSLSLTSNPDYVSAGGGLPEPLAGPSVHYDVADSSTVYSVPVAHDIAQPGPAYAAITPRSNGAYSISLSESDTDFGGFQG